MPDCSVNPNIVEDLQKKFVRKISNTILSLTNFLLGVHFVIRLFVKFDQPI